MESELTSAVLDVAGNDFDSINEDLYRRNLTDGLPVVPPTQDRVEHMIAGQDRAPGDLVGVIPPRYGDATVETIAINAVMAGCKPEYMPVIMTAIEAMTDDSFNLYGINATTHPVAPLTIVNGPIVDELHLNYGYNVFGQGWRANSTIGRAIRLILVNVGGGRPGDMDRATHGIPAKFAYCIAENERKSPWEPFHVRNGYDAEESTVTVVGADAPHEINDHVSDTANGVLTTAADVFATMGNNNAYLSEGEITFILGPEHAQTVARDDYSVKEIRRYLYDHARNRLSKLKTGGMYGIHDWPERFDTRDPNALIPLVHSPDRINVLVAGGAGKHSMAIHSFGETRSVIRAVD